MEEWRKAFLQKTSTKAFIESDFLGAFQAVLDDESASLNTIEKGYVADQLIWHWNNLNESGHVYEYDDEVQKQKYNYKNVANNLMEKYFTKK